MHLHKGKEILHTVANNDISQVTKSEISLTAYKTYILFKMLLVRPFSKEEINEYFKNDPIIAKKFHSDSVANSVNTLRAVGCDISRPSPSNDYKYILYSHPFKFELTQEQVNLLCTVLKSLSSQLDWQFLYKINNLYKKILSNALTRDYYCDVEKYNVFKGIDSALLTELNYHSLNKNKITISYLSPVNQTEELTISANDIFIENDRLYLWCYSHKYNDASYLRADKIKAIKGVELNAPKIKLEKIKIKYILKGNSMETFIASDDEHVLEKGCDFIIVEAQIISRFNFFQKILSYGRDCTIIEPKEIRCEFIKYLDNIAERYK